MRFSLVWALVGLPFSVSAQAEAFAPCARAYVPGMKASSLVERKLAASGVEVVNPESKEERWKELVASASLEKETREFDLVDRDVFLRRLEALPLLELTRLYPGIQANKLKIAKKGLTDARTDFISPSLSLGCKSQQRLRGQEEDPIRLLSRHERFA